MAISMKKIDAARRTGTVTSESIPAVARKVYAMLTVAIALATAGGYVGASIHLSPMVGLVLAIVSLVLIFALAAFPTGLPGLAIMYTITTLLGMSIGPTIEHYLHMPNGPLVVFQSLLITAGIFIGLTLYAFVSKKDFSFLGGFLFVSLLVLILVGVVNLFVHSPMMNMLYSAGIAIIMSGYILYDTSKMIRSGEDQAILITLSLFLDIINLFLALLNLLSNDD